MTTRSPHGHRPDRRLPPALLPALLVALIPFVVVVVDTSRRALADVIHLEGGGKVRGEIVRQTDREVIIKTPAGLSVIPRDEIASIEKASDPKADYAKKAKALRSSQKADAHFELGMWAKKKKLVDESKESFRRAIELDHDHEDARAELGYRKHAGKWLDEEEYKQDVLGLVWFDGQWVNASDADKLRQGFVKNDKGQWTRPDLERDEPGGDDYARSTPKPSGGASSPKLPGGGSTGRPSSGAGGSSVPRGLPKPGSGGNGGRGWGGFPRPGGGGRGAAPAGPKEDTDWYNDNSGVPWEQASTYSSKYYDIKSNVKDEYLKRYGKMMDQYYVKFKGVFKHFMPKGEIRRSPIWIYKSQQEFMSREGMSQGVGGFYSSGNKRVTGYHGRFGMNGTTRTVLAHEGTHQFEDIVLQGGFYRAPIWILEGLAVFFESAYYDLEKNKVEIGNVPADRLSNLKRGIRNNSTIPLTDLIRTPQPSFTAYHYAHAWGLIYMMLYFNGDEKARKRNNKVFTDLFFMAKTKRVSPEDVEAIFGGRDKFLKFEEEWKKWIADLPYDFDPKKNK